MRILLAALAALAVAPAAARADTLTAGADSARNPALDPSMDLAHVGATFDTAGTWTLDVRVYGTGSPAGITGTLYAAGCGTPIASVTTDPASQTATITAPGKAVHAPARLHATGTAGETVWEIGDADLAGIAPGCVTVVSASGGTVLDSLSSLPFTGAATPAPSPSPAPAPPPPACTIAPTLPTAPLTASRRGVVAVSLGQFSCGVRGTVRVRAGKRTIGRRAYRAQAQRAVTVRVRLNKASRRRLARGVTLSVKVVVTANAGATHTRASVDTTIRRR